MRMIAALAASLFLTSPAMAQTQCGLRADLVKHLSTKYGESRASMGVDAVGQLVETFSNPKTGTWTVTATIPGGPTCVMSSGHSFVQEAQAEEGQGS